MSKTMTLEQAQRALDTAFRKELTAVDSLPAKPTKARTGRCWKLAAATNRARKVRDAIAMVGCGVFHAGEHGKVEAYADCYAEPMVRVRFGARVATLKPSEIGAR